jgi:carbon-monoxide dehydrogenase catalytic subunit
MVNGRVAEEKAIDLASLLMLNKSAEDGTVDAFAWADAQGKSCTFGTEGMCCRICHMGLCRITKKSPLGVCGANGDTIAARNLYREVAAGSSAHSDHGRSLVLLLKSVAEGRVEIIRSRMKTVFVGQPVSGGSKMKVWRNMNWPVNWLICS